MTITLSLEPEVEQGLEARARQRGLSLSAYLEEMVRRDAASAPAAQKTGSERAEEFFSWVKTLRQTEPLSDEAVSRAAMYQDLE